MSKWIKISDKLPSFDKKVLFRGVISWRSVDKFKYFDDELTTNEETLEYGLRAYTLKDNSDFLVCQHPDFGDIYDEYVTHWMEIPTDGIE